MPKKTQKFIGYLHPNDKKRRLQLAEKRASETAEERECRLENGRVARAVSRANETEEQRERRLIIHAARTRAVRRSVGGSELMHVKAKLRRACETAKERECRLEKLRVAAAASRANETEEQRERRLESNRIRIRAARAKAAGLSVWRSELTNAKLKLWQTSETAEERESRLEKLRGAAAASNASETEERRERRLKRKQIRLARAARRSVARSELVHEEFDYDPHSDQQNCPDPLIAKMDEIRRRCSAKKYEVEHGMTARMIVPTSVQDSTAGRRRPTETSASSDFQQFEFWVNGVKRTIKIPLHSEVEPNSNGSGEVINVDPGDIDEVHPCSFSADTIVIDPDVNDESPLSVSLSPEELVLLNSFALDTVGHFQNDKGAVSQNNQSNARQNDQITINPARLGSTRRSSMCEKRKALTVRTELENIRSLHLPTFDATTHVNQSITSQAQLRTDHRPIMHSYVTNSQPQKSGLLVPSTLSKYGRQSVGSATNSNVSVIPSEFVKPSNSSAPLNMSDAGYKSLLQTVNSGIPVIMTSNASQPLGRDGRQPVLLSSSASNGSLAYVLQPQWQLNTTNTANCSSSTGAVQPGLAMQTAASQNSLMLMNKQSHYSVPLQTSCVPLGVSNSLVNSSGAANQSVNLSQFVALNGSSSVPAPLDPLSAQVRKVKITTDVNGSCIISVDGLRATASSYADKQLCSNMPNVLGTHSVLASAVPFAMPNGTGFQIMRPNVIQNCQAIRLVPSGGLPLRYMPSNTVGNHRPLNILPNNNAFYLKPPDCRAYSIPPLSFASQNAGMPGFEPSCTMQTGLTVQSRANGARLVNGALCTGSAQASSTSSFPVGMLSLSMLPSPIPLSVIEPPQPSVKCSSAASSASFSINSGAMLSKCSSPHPSSIPSGLQSSTSLTLPSLARAVPVTGVRAMRTHRNTMSVPSVESTIDATARSCNKLNAQSENRFQALQVPFRPRVTVHSNVLKSGCLTSDALEASQNLVMPPVTRTVLIKRQVPCLMAIVTKSPTVVSDGGGAITTPSASGVKSVSSFLVSSASAWETPTFPQWSRPAIRKSGDILSTCGASTVSSAQDKAPISGYTWYPPTICLQTSSAMDDKVYNSIMTQNYHSTGSTVPLLIPRNVFPVSLCPNGTSSLSTFSVAQQPTQSLSTPQITKSMFSFYNSHLKRSPDCKSFDKPVRSSENLQSNTSTTSAEFVAWSSKNISNGPTGIDSSLIPVPVQFYECSNAVKKRKRKSSAKIKDILSSFSWDSSSSTSDNINLLSDPESGMSSSDSWSSDDSLTMGRQKTRRRRRKRAKRIDYECDSYSPRPVQNSEVYREISERRCFVSLENLYLNGKTSVDIRDASENLVCCRSPMQRPTSTVDSLGSNVSRKKSYKLWTAVNYISDTDEL